MIALDEVLVTLMLQQSSHPSLRACINYRNSTANESFLDFVWTQKRDNLSDSIFASEAQISYMVVYRNGEIHFSTIWRRTNENLARNS